MIQRQLIQLHPKHISRNPCLDYAGLDQPIALPPHIAHCQVYAEPPFEPSRDAICPTTPCAAIGKLAVGKTPARSGALQ